MTGHKYARIERERRYLVHHLPEDMDQYGDYTCIIDSYITGTRLRLRRIEMPGGEDIRYKLGQKYLADVDDLENTVMTNIYLEKKEYALLSELPGASLTKRRYTYMYVGQRFSLDVFEGQLAGLILCEIELAAGKTVAIDLPPFVGPEVTQDVRFSGGELVQCPIRDILSLVDQSLG